MIEIVRDTTFKLSAFRESYNLDGTIYFLVLKYNSRSQSWFLNIQDAEQNCLSCSLKLNTGALMLKHSRHVSGLPEGDFLTVQTSSSDSVINFDNFGDEFKLYYYSSDELPAVESSLGMVVE